MTPELTDTEVEQFAARMRSATPEQRAAKRQQFEALFAAEKRCAAALDELRAQERLLAEKLENLADEWRSCGEALQRVRSQIADVIDNGVPYD